MADRLDRALELIRADASAETGASFARIAARYLQRAAQGEGPVSLPPFGAPPADAGAGSDDHFAPRARGASLEDVLAALEDVVAGANRLWHPMYMGHQVAPPLPAAIWTEPVIAALNQSLAVREMSPSATRIEHALIRWMCGLVWGDHGARATGTFTSGGTEAIFTSLLAARNAALPDAAVAGVRGPAAIVCGEHAHYAVRRTAAQLGLGSSGSVLVRSAAGRMDVDDLTRTLDRLAGEGVPVVAVVATAGSTATGAFDPLERIASVCGERGIWLHADAAHGGSALLSARHRHRLAGIERADSVSWDPHKMMLMPLSAGVVLLRDAGRLERAFGQDAPYLFRRDVEADGDDAPARPAPEGGMLSFMCSRRADPVKVWVALRRYGIEGIAALFDSLCARTRELYELLRARDDFEVLHEPECNILCFRWVGAPRRPDAELNDLNLELRERWNGSGAGWITTTVLDGKRVLRVVLMNPLTGAEHLRATAEGLAALAGQSSFATPNPPR